MNFFQAQDSARRKTWQLALLFGGAVLTLVLLTNLLVLVTIGWTGTQVGVLEAPAIPIEPVWPRPAPVLLGCSFVGALGGICWAIIAYMRERDIRPLRPMSTPPRARVSEV